MTHQRSHKRLCIPDMRDSVSTMVDVTFKMVAAALKRDVTTRSAHRIHYNNRRLTSSYPNVCFDEGR